MSTTDFNKTWWSVRFDHWGVAPTISDHPDPTIRAEQTGWRAVVKHDVLCECHSCRRAVLAGAAGRMSSTSRVFHADFGFEALAQLDEELTEAQR